MIIIIIYYCYYYIDDYRIICIYIYTINYLPLIKYLVSHALRLRHIEAPLSNLWPSRPCKMGRQGVEIWYL